MLHDVVNKNEYILYFNIYFRWCIWRQGILFIFGSTSYGNCSPAV